MNKATPPHDPANPELEQELPMGYQSLAEILSDNTVTGYHRKYGLHNTSLLEDLGQFVFQQNQVAHEEGRKEELQEIITDAICMRPDCETLHYKHAYEKAVMRLAELEKGKPE